MCFPHNVWWLQSIAFQVWNMIKLYCSYPNMQYHSETMLSQHWARNTTHNQRHILKSIPGPCQTQMKEAKFGFSSLQGRAWHRHLPHWPHRSAGRTCVLHASSQRCLKTKQSRLDGSKDKLSVIKLNVSPLGEDGGKGCQDLHFVCLIQVYNTWTDIVIGSFTAVAVQKTCKSSMS